MFKFFQILIFCCLIISYFQLTAVVFGVIIGILSIPFDLIQKFTKKESSKTQVVVITSYFGITLLIIFLILFFHYQLWLNEHIRFWANPFLIFALYCVSVLVGTSSGDQNPFVGSVKTLFGKSLIPTIIVFFVGYLSKTTTANWMLEWGVATGAGSFLLAHVYSTLTGILRDLAKTEIQLQPLQKRLKDIWERIHRLERVVNAINTTDEKEQLDRMLSNIKECVSSVEDSFNPKKAINIEGAFLKADAEINQAEIEIKHAEDYLFARAQTLIPQELRRKLDQAKTQLQMLRTELHGAVISLDELHEIESAIEKHLSNIDSLKISKENIISQIDEFEAPLNRISDIKTALRLRKNFGSGLDSIRDGVIKEKTILKIAKQLDLETSEADNQMKNLLDQLTVFESQQSKSTEELIVKYQNLLQAQKSFLESMAKLRSKIDKGWDEKKLIESQMYLYIPRFCRTDSPSQCLLVYKLQRNGLQNSSLKFDGIHLNLPKDCSIYLDQNYLRLSFYKFPISGVKSVKGSLICQSSNLRISENNFPIKIIPNKSELFRESLTFATPVGALFVLIFWLLGLDLGMYMPIAAAIGTMTCLLVILIKSLNLKKIA